MPQQKSKWIMLWLILHSCLNKASALFSHFALSLTGCYNTCVVLFSRVPNFSKSRPADLEPFFFLKVSWMGRPCEQGGGIVVEVNPSPFNVLARETHLLIKQLSLTVFFNQKHFCFRNMFPKWQNGKAVVSAMIFPFITNSVLECAVMQSTVVIMNRWGLISQHAFFPDCAGLSSSCLQIDKK